MTLPAGARVRGQRRNKFNATRGMFGGRMFDSTLERDRFTELSLLEAAGEIHDLVDHPRVQVEPSVFYKADSAYVEGGQQYVEDVKGRTTRLGERFSLICRLWKLHGCIEYGRVPLRIVTRNGKRGGFMVVKTIVPEEQGHAQ